jgi:hypothetical protein
MSNNTWFDELMGHVHSSDHRVLDFKPQAVRILHHRKQLPDVYKRDMGEPCEATYLQPHLRGSGGIVDAPVASCDGGELVPELQPK